MQRCCLARSAWRSSVQVGREGTPGSPGLAGGVSFSSSILTAEHRSVYVMISCISNLFGLVWMTIVHIAPPSRPMGWDPLFIPPPLFLRTTPFWCFGSLRFALQASFALGSVAPVWYFSGFIFMSRECLVYEIDRAIQSSSFGRVPLFWIGPAGLSLAGSVISSKPITLPIFGILVRFALTYISGFRIVLHARSSFLVFIQSPLN
ncbi:hypothetical protein B0H11DRAFT_1029673 [Mycena galericulata]|nr:hypothetical protein B0H11DRAFT_1029673 [Mycena galericulata]